MHFSASFAQPFVKLWRKPARIMLSFLTLALYREPCHCSSLSQSLSPPPSPSLLPPNPRSPSLFLSLSLPLPRPLYYPPISRSTSLFLSLTIYIDVCLSLSNPQSLSLSLLPPCLSLRLISDSCLSLLPRLFYPVSSTPSLLPRLSYPISPTPSLLPLVPLSGLKLCTAVTVSINLANKLMWVHGSLILSSLVRAQCVVTLPGCADLLLLEHRYMSWMALFSPILRVFFVFAQGELRSFRQV